MPLGSAEVKTESGCVKSIKEMAYLNVGNKTPETLPSGASDPIETLLAHSRTLPCRTIDDMKESRDGRFDKITYQENPRNRVVLKTASMIT
jgi:hypothetical protein